MRSYLYTVTSKIVNQVCTWKMCHCGLKLIVNMHQPCPFCRTFELSLVIHVAAEPYAYSYVSTCTLLHVAKIIQQAWLHRKCVTVKIKQKNLETSFD